MPLRSVLRVLLVALLSLSVEGATIALGYDHSCAQMSDSTMKCWGRNDNGQLGDGTTTDRATPVEVSGITTLGASLWARTTRVPCCQMAP